MRHRKRRGRLARPSGHREAILKNLVRSLLEYERIRTTQPKGRELLRLTQHLLSLASRGDLHSRREVQRIIDDRSVVTKLFTEVAPRYKERRGGCVRLLKVGQRRGDGAPMVIVELMK